MNVFVVVGGWNYEGLDDPIGVYSTHQLAEAALACIWKRGRRSCYDYMNIVEREMDEPQELKTGTEPTTK